MEIYICYDFGKVNVTTSALETAIHMRPSTFLMALIKGEVCYFDGSVKHLFHMINDPYFKPFLDEYSEKRISDLKRLLSALEECQS